LGRDENQRDEPHPRPGFHDPIGGPMNTRTIAIIALVIAVVILIILLT
jgi:hypothetical protein